MTDFESPHVRIVYKSISPESVQQPEFLNPLLKVMRRRRVPIIVIESLFSAGDVAPQQPDSPKSLLSVLECAALVLHAVRRTWFGPG
jgi:hypothetical protein